MINNIFIILIICLIFEIIDWNNDNIYLKSYAILCNNRI